MRIWLYGLHSKKGEYSGRCGMDWLSLLDYLTTRALAGIKSRICTLANNQLCGMVTTKWVWCGIVNISPRTQAFRAWNTQLILYSMKPNQGKLLTISQIVLMLNRDIVGAGELQFSIVQK